MKIYQMKCVCKVTTDFDHLRVERPIHKKRFIQSSYCSWARTVTLRHKSEFLLTMFPLSEVSLVSPR